MHSDWPFLLQIRAPGVHPIYLLIDECHIYPCELSQLIRQAPLSSLVRDSARCYAIDGTLVKGQELIHFTGFPFRTYFRFMKRYQFG